MRALNDPYGFTIAELTHYGFSEFVTSSSERLSRGKPLGVDIEVSLGIDLTDKQYRALLIDSATVGLSIAEPFIPVVIQNAPAVGQLALLRLFGATNIVYGDTVVAGDLLKVESAGDRAVPFVRGTDGHTHASDAAPMESVLVRVVNVKGSPVTGLTGSDIVARHWFRAGGSISEHAASTSVSEDGGGDGWYVVETTAISALGCPHRLSIEMADPGYLVSPSEYAWTPRGATSGSPADASYAYCMGTALTDGAADELGLMILRPQLF